MWKVGSISQYSVLSLKAASKLSEPVDVKPEESLSSRIHSSWQGYWPSAERMQASDMISSYFPEQLHKGFVHVIVERMQRKYQSPGIRA